MNILYKLSAALALVASASLSHAVPLTQNVLTPLPGTTLAARPELAGLVIADVTSSPFLLDATNGVVTGDVQEQVVQEFGTGTLDFYWRVFVNDRSQGTLSYFRLGNFFTPTYDADWRIDGLGDIPSDNAYYFGNGFVNFGFSQGINADQSSMYMFLHTDATSYTDDGRFDLADAGTLHESQSFNTFAPTVPDAGTTAGLFGLGLVGVALARRFCRIGAAGS